MELRFTDSRPQMPGDSSQGLRPLGWSELCARLVAAHDTRGVLTGPNDNAVSGALGGRRAASDDGGAGSQTIKGFSFHDSAATLLKNVEVQAEGAVNPASSANGNDAEGTQDAVPNASMKRRPDENRHD